MRGATAASAVAKRDWIAGTDPLREMRTTSHTCHPHFLPQRLLSSDAREQQQAQWQYQTIDAAVSGHLDMRLC